MTFAASMVENRIQRLMYQLAEKVGENGALRAQNQALREALEAVEWDSDGFGKMYCPTCDNYRTYGHKSDCKLGNALKLARG